MSTIFRLNISGIAFVRAISGGFCLGALLQLSPVAAQALQPLTKGMHAAKAEYFAESLPARELAAIGIAQNRKRLSTDPFYEEKNASNKRHIRKYPADAVITPDAALWTDTGALAPRAAPNPPTVGFNGMSKADTVAVGQGFLPPDTTGAVGPNHFVQSVNSTWAVWDRSGTSLIATTALSSLFSALPGPCATANDGDPIVLYDQLADRFLIAQFCYSVDSTPNHQVIAISKTGDPTGAYYLYDFRMPNLKFNDYPKFGVWPDAYYMTDNQFNQAGGAFMAAGAFAFDRSKMLSGDPTASYVYFDMEALFPADGIGGMLPASVDGFVPPPSGAPAPFVYFTAGEFGDAAGDALRIFDFHVDFAVPANSTFTERPGSPLPVAAFDPRVVPNTRNVIPQPSPATSAHYLDALNDRLMFRLAYRNFGSSESLVLNHTVNAAVNPAYRAGVRVYQLNRATPAAAFTIAEQATYAGLDTTTHRWLGSVAMNHQGDLALGYSVSSTSVIPSIRYVAKLGAQSLATGLAQGETEIKTGGGVPQTSASGRWGDYSQMSVDPVDDCTFWYTQEYYATGGTGTSPWRTWIAKFAPGACTTSPRGTISGTITACAGGAAIPNALVRTASGGYSRATGSAGTYGITVTPGTYSVTVSAFGYSSATSGSLSVSNAGTVTYNTCLNAAPVIQVATPVTVVAENALPANSLADPGETVTVSFPLRNIGLANTTNLVATLQAGGGVTAPGAAQNYGVVVASGSSASQNFSFTATGSCGAAITPTLALQDGATNLGTISYAMQLGAPGAGVLFSQFFDTVTAPALPAGWTTVGGGGLSAWVTSTTTPSSAPNAAFVAGAGSTGNSELVSPQFDVGADGGKVSFRNFYNLEDGFDGMVLEISINGGAFSDIIAAGGKVIAGGYNDIISSVDGSGIAGRTAWTGISGGGASAAYITSTIALPPTAAGQSVRLKWRVVTDSTATPASSGVRIDNVEVTRNDCGTLRPLDVDLTGTYRGTTDGAMLLRYLLGLPIAAVTANAVGTGAQRVNPAQILIHLDKIRPLLDIDGNGQADALTDGLMILRYMLGLRDAAVTQNAVAVSPPPTRDTAQINARLQSLMP